MAKKIDYRELPSTNTICPIMSMHQVSWDSSLIECIGEHCQWNEFCHRHDNDIIGTWPEDWNILDE